MTYVYKLDDRDNNKKERLVYEQLYNEIVESYIAQLIQFDQTDETIPEEVWSRFEK